VGQGEDLAAVAADHVRVRDERVQNRLVDGLDDRAEDGAQALVRHGFEGVGADIGSLEKRAIRRREGEKDVARAMACNGTTAADAEPAAAREAFELVR
jgi:hypothetical protein